MNHYAFTDVSAWPLTWCHKRCAANEKSCAHALRMECNSLRLDVVGGKDLQQCLPEVCFAPLVCNLYITAEVYPGFDSSISKDPYYCVLS